MKQAVNQLVNKRKLFSMLRRTRHRQKEAGIVSFDDLNKSVEGGTFDRLIEWSEAGFNRQLDELWNSMRPARGNLKLICIAGPSSSGKTTFSFRLRELLLKQGLPCRSISLDNYFKSRDQTPRDENGEFDFEDINALDLDLLNADLVKLIRGDEVIVPQFNFKSGEREPGRTGIRLAKDEVVIIEGIHGLNARLTRSVSDRNKFKIYLTAMLQIKNHKGHWLHSTDHRFIRRIVRDSRYRGYDAQTTIERWPSVIRGERKNIFPFQDQAHFVFNSGLLYEYPVLKRFAFDLLVEINKRDHIFLEARKLLSVLNYFDFAPEALLPKIPADSVLREFIGGSRYEY